MNLNFDSSLDFCSRVFLCHSSHPCQPPPLTSKPISYRKVVSSGVTRWKLLLNSPVIFIITFPLKPISSQVFFTVFDWQTLTCMSFSIPVLPIEGRRFKTSLQRIWKQGDVNNWGHFCNQSNLRKKRGQKWRISLQSHSKMMPQVKSAVICCDLFFLSGSISDHSIYTETMVLNMGIPLTFKSGRVIRNQKSKDPLGRATHRLQSDLTKLAVRKQAIEL